MKYREFGSIKDKVSVLGFGCMRLPTTDDNSAHIDEEKAFEMLSYAKEHGVNYFDTAYGYHSGESERFVGRFFQKFGGRTDVHVATKLPSWLVKTHDDIDRLFSEQLEKLQMDYVDYYLLHAVNKEHWENYKENKIFDWVEKALADGRIRQIGFSFHDENPVFTDIIDSYHWDFTQVQYNYMDIENQAGTKGVQHAGAKDVSVVVMEPILGGRLANPPKEIAALWETSAVKRSPVDWALQWVWNQPEVKVVLSGMSTLDQVKENVAIADRSSIGVLNADELKLYDQVRQAYKELSPIPCTNCQYCLPCTVGITIPRLFGMYNEARMYGTLDDIRGWYKHVEADKQASACIDCEECEPKCPQHIVISDWMVKVDAVMMGGKSFNEVM